MKTIVKSSIALFLAASSLTAAGCSSNQSSEEAETTTIGTTDANTQVVDTTDIARFTDEEISAYLALAAQDIERAGVITKATIEAYMTEDSSGNITVARYYDPLSARGGTTDVASVWHYTAFLQMVSHMIQVSTSEEDISYYTDLYAKLIDSLDFYKGTTRVTTYSGTNRTTFYGVNRASSKNSANVSGDQAVYDDQMWIIMDLMDAYEFTGNVDYFTEAVRLTNICLEGWDVTLDADGNEYGGITWGPSYATKHACSNGPLIEPLVSIWAAYQAAGQESQATYYLEWADKIYTWEINHLLTSSGLFGDLIGTSREIIDGKLVTSSQSSSIDEHFYTYNTGVMLSAAARLYGATGESKYLTSGKRWAKAAYRYFATKDKGTGIDEYPLTSQTTWFNAILLQGFLDMAKYDDASLTYVASMQSSIDYAYENYLKKDGFLPRSYVKGWDKGNEYDSSKNVMDQASAAMSYAMMAAFYQSLSK